MMMIHFRSALLVLLFVTTFIRYGSATSRKETKVFWKPEEKMNLMKIWNRIYKGKHSRKYKQTLYEEWLKMYPDARGKSEGSVMNKAQRLLEKTFVIPPEHHDQYAIRLSMDVKRKRDLGFPDYVEILPPNYEKRPQNYNQHAHPQMDWASTSGHQQTTHDVTGNDETNRKVQSEEKIPYTPWERIDDINLMKAQLQVQEYKRTGKYREKLLQVFENSDPKPAKRTNESVFVRAKELKRKGFVIPAEYNNGEEIRIKPGTEHKRTRWDPMEEINLMKAWYAVQKYRNSKNYQEKFLETWDTLHSEPSTRSPNCILNKSRELRRRGYVIPAEYNNGEMITIEPYTNRENTRKKREEPGLIVKHKERRPRGHSERQHDQSNNRSKVIHAYSGPSSPQTHHIQPLRPSLQTNIPSPYADLITEHYEHQPMYHPQFQHFYHGFNDSSYGGSVTPRPQHGTYNPPVYQSDIAQYHHETTSSTHYQSHPQPNPNEDESQQPSTSHSIPKHLYDMPMYSPPYHYPGSDD